MHVFIKVLMLWFVIECRICLKLSKWYVFSIIIGESMKSNKRWIHSSTNAMCRVDSFFGCNAGDEEEDDNTANAVSSSIKMDYN